MQGSSTDPERFQDRAPVVNPSERVDLVVLDVWEWLGRRTFHFSSFEPRELVAEKRGTAVSVVLPALNEERTVGPIVRCLREALVEAIPLVDEIVVIDPGSTDDTAAVARKEGARVVSEADVLPELGRVPGKGEALWKSLHVTDGDLLVFLDADVENIHPSFVYGLLGPLLTDPSVQYVKAFYERPLAERDRLRPTGGGRVTELVARPLINLWWPELAGLIQPLSGEYAGRRSVLDRVPFVSGYGVELGLLVDLLNLVGLNALAQVDLHRRVHRNQDAQALGRMSFGILQAALSRLEDEGRASFGESPATTLLQFKSRHRDYLMLPHDLPVTERPPAVTVPSYSRRWAL